MARIVLDDRDVEGTAAIIGSTIGAVARVRMIVRRRRGAGEKHTSTRVPPSAGA